MTPTENPRRQLAPEFPVAQQYALLGGAFLFALGILCLVFEDPGFGAVGPVVEQPEFLIWPVNGWTAVVWIGLGGLGVLSSGRVDDARTYAASAAVIFAGVAVWGFVDGDNIAGLLVAGNTNNITHAVLAAWGLLAVTLLEDR